MIDLATNQFSMYDLIVIGAGWFGIAAAKSYIELNPDDAVLVLEAGATVGGTWSQDRLYPGLKSNNMVGSYEYPGFPMDERTYGVKDGDHIPAAILHRYLTDYARHFGVLQRTAFNSSVLAIEPSQNVDWKVTTSWGDGVKVLQTKKLIVSTGLTSQPNMLEFEGQNEFNAPLFHAKDFCRQASATKSAKNVVVVGGAKSAFDIAYAFVENGAQVDLLIRPNGNGPVWLSPAYVTPLKRKIEELLHTRALTWFSPCPWGGEDGFSLVRYFLHETTVGRWIVHNFWHALGSDIISLNGYDAHPETKKLKPWSSPYWVASGLSIHNYKTNFFDLVKDGKIRVHEANVEKLSHKTVHTSTGISIPADALVCATGWKKGSSVEFLNCDLDIPESSANAHRMIEEANRQVLTRFPDLASQPVLRYQPKPEDPLRFYRFMIPTAAYQNRNIAFAGAVSTVSTSICASIQGLWISAFFGNQLKRSAASQKDAVQEAVLNSQWGVWRYPCGYSRDLPDMAFDVLPYFDVLMRDLGLKVHRKLGPWAELTEPYKPTDYGTLTDEWNSTQINGKLV